MSAPEDTASGGVKPARWFDPANKLFPHQVGFTAPPHDFDAAPHDFLRIAPEGVGVHGRLLHLASYQHQLKQRVDNFALLEEVVHCMANAGADVVGQVGTNWVHAGGKRPEEIRAFLDRMRDTYDTPLHMAGYCLVEALQSLGAERIAINAVYYWPDWRDGIARFLRDAGFEVITVGNFVDLGIAPNQETVNAANWIFPGDFALRSMIATAERAPEADAIVVTGMPNFRRADNGLPQRPVTLAAALEAAVGKPLVASDLALYWRIFKTLGQAPLGAQGLLLGSLQD